MNKYYSPQLHRDVVSFLYHEGKRRRIPMTRLASQLIRDALRRREQARQRMSAGKLGKRKAPDAPVPVRFR